MAKKSKESTAGELLSNWLDQVPGRLPQPLKDAFDEASWNFATNLVEKRGDCSFLLRLLNGERNIPRSARKWFANVVAGKRGLARRRGITRRISLLDAVTVRATFQNFKWTSEFYKRNPHEIDDIAREHSMPRESVRTSLSALGLDMSSAGIIDYLANKFNASPATIRDVIAKRGAYAEK